ncbi:methionine adenosyltransferase domain-containing protein [Breoghania sp.]|uniref:methionine adenosyltransferase domain-containing protein n=1 Tax=Breoghania sp. TaxID=2065378 RepID=UPI002639A91C|nr:methionine adenosyltransferase domain-containing protein [Breoghania sp.]
MEHSATQIGYACRHTPELMPLPIVAAHRLSRRLEVALKDGAAQFLSPDGQVQVAVEFRERSPVRIHNIGLTAALSEGVGVDEIRMVEELLRNETIPAAFEGLSVAPDHETRILVRTVPAAGEGMGRHSGLTGRKTADDGYGGFCRQATGSLSGKDPRRIDRTAAYAARHIGKCVAAADLAGECEVQLSYCAGQDEAVSLAVDTFASGRIADDEIFRRVMRRFDLTPAAIAERYRLWQLPADNGGHFYARLAAYGHNGPGGSRCAVGGCLGCC